MKFCYQVATPDVIFSPNITAYQGPVEESFSALADLGYDGVELMTRSPENINWRGISRLASQKGLDVVLVCTGEIFVQLGVSFCDKDPEGRVLAIKKTKEMMDYASHFGAMINVGRLRGEYCPEIPCEHTDQWLVDALQELGEYGEKKRVPIALETVGKFQTNFINILEQAVKFLEGGGSAAVQVMMDIFHMQLEESDYIRSIQQYHDRNIHVHLADSDRYYPGHGQLHFDEIIRLFSEFGYQGAFTAEILQLPNQYFAAESTVSASDKMRGTVEEKCRIVAEVKRKR